MKTLTLCEAIARQEGWLISTSRARRNHNPGNIRAGYFASNHGAVGSDGSFAIFKNDQDGFNAMSELLEGFYHGDTVAQALARYAPPSENNTPRYITDVCEWTGLTPSTLLTSYILAPPNLDVSAVNASQSTA